MEKLCSRNCKIGYQAAIETSIHRYFDNTKPWHYLHLNFSQSIDCALETNIVINSVNSDDIKKISDMLAELAQIVKQDEELALVRKENEKK